MSSHVSPGCMCPRDICMPKSEITFIYRQSAFFDNQWDNAIIGEGGCCVTCQPVSQKFDHVRPLLNELQAIKSKLLSFAAQWPPHKEGTAIIWFRNPSARPDISPGPSVSQPRDCDVFYLGHWIAKSSILLLMTCRLLSRGRAWSKYCETGWHVTQHPPSPMIALSQWFSTKCGLSVDECNF